MELHSELLSLADLAMMAKLGSTVKKEILSSCLECQKNVRVGSLRRYHINLEESMIICDNDMCCFMSEELPADVPSVDSMAVSSSDLHDILSSFDSQVGQFSLFDTPVATSYPVVDIPAPIISDRSISADKPPSNGCISGVVAPDRSPTNIAISDRPPSPVFEDHMQEMVDSMSSSENAIFTPIATEPCNVFDPVTTHDMLTSSPDRLTYAQDNPATATEPMPKKVSVAAEQCSFINSLDASVRVDKPLGRTDTNGNCGSSDTDVEFVSATPVPSVPARRSVTDPVPTSPPVRCHYLMLWKNIDALCWLDVLLGALCHNQSVRAASESLPYSSVIKKLLLAYDESQALIEPLQGGDNSILQTVMERDRASVKRGGGYCMDNSSSWLTNIARPTTALSSQELSSATRKIHLADIKLECVREEIWQSIEPLLRCERGKDDSPVFAFPLMVRKDNPISDLFLTEYSWSTQCTECHYTEDTREQKHMITFPKITKFEISRGVMLHVKACAKCLSSCQRRLSINRYTSNLVVHFSEGMLHSNLDELAFTADTGQRYLVSAVIEYKTSPNHFALWQRDIRQSQPGNWMCYDDLQSQYAKFSIEKFAVPAQNIHMVFWESIQSEASTPHYPHSAQKSGVHHPTPSRQSVPLISAKAQQPTDESKRSVEFKRLAVANSNLPEPTIKPQLNKQLLVVKTDQYSSTPSNELGATSVISPQVTPATPAPRLGNLSKLLTSSKYSRSAVNSETGAVKKPLALLSKKISTKHSLADGLAYGTNIPSAETCRTIMDAISVMGPPARTAPTTLQKCYTRPSRASSAAKSYMDMVKPLLQKNKQQNGRVLGGYVPRSQRADAEQTAAKRKKVMFTDGAEKKAKPVIPVKSVLINDVEAIVTPALLSPPRSTKNRAKVHGVVDDFVPYSAQTSKRVEGECVDTVDMPTLDDILSCFSF